jgi:hypothetical protein
MVNLRVPFKEYKESEKKNIWNFNLLLREYFSGEFLFEFHGTLKKEPWKDKLVSCWLKIFNLNFFLKKMSWFLFSNQKWHKELKKFTVHAI